MTTLQDKKVVITAIGHHHPHHKIENSFFDTLDIGSDAAWVQERTGIESRRSVISEDDLRDLRYEKTTLEEIKEAGRYMTIADLGEKSWQSMLERFHGDTSLTDTLVLGTSIPDYDIPANACTVAARLGLEVASYVTNSACSSFVVNLHTNRALMRTGQAKQVALFIAERYSMRIDYADRATACLFGDGSAAMILETGDDKQGLEVLDTHIVSHPSKFDTVRIPVGGTFWQNGSAVQKFAVTRTVEATRQIMERNDLTPEKISYFIGHQANLRMLTSSARRIGLNEEQHLYNVNQFGNQGAAGAPSVLSMNWDKFKSGDLIVISVVGSGLTWGSALLRKV